jgi:hypothetical protein
MTPKSIRAHVCAALDALLAVGEAYDGLFPSLIDRTTCVMLTELPPPIAGQRNGDRAHRGSNLVHDEPTLMTLYALDRPEYTAAADRYLRTFATHCTDTVSGLFPWGEHAFWDLDQQRPGNSYLLADLPHDMPLTHDHLRAIPRWLWEKLYAFNPTCLTRFADGLDNHWVNSDPPEYIRHALIDEKERHPAGGTSCDFPRHGGFYICDWVFAYIETGNDVYLSQIKRMMDYWWEKQQPNGLCNTESRSVPGHFAYGVCAVAQTLSLALSLLESADLLEPTQPHMAGEMRHRAASYTDGFFYAPHDPEQGVFVSGLNYETGEARSMVIWGSVYGQTPAAYVALVCLAHYRHSSDERVLSWARAVGRRYVQEPFPNSLPVPAVDAGLGLGLLSDLYDLTGEAHWLDDGFTLAEELISIYFDKGVLPRGAAGIDWYESQMGPGFLLHGLTRLALLAEKGRDCPLAADYTCR